MKTYIIFWVIFIIIRAISGGLNEYRKSKRAGYYINRHETTGEKHKIEGTLFQNTIAASLALLFNPAFLFWQTLLFLPAAFVLYIIL